MNDIVLLLSNKGNLKVDAELLISEEEEPFFLDKYVIPTNSIFAQIWKLLLIILSMMSSFHYAFAAAFLEHVSPESKENFLSWDLAYNVIFAVDLVL